MADAPQTFASHTRWHPPFHFFIAPVMMINFFWSIWKWYTYLTWDCLWWVVVSLALLVLTFLVRINPLTVQDRLIRLEERLRLREVLPAELARQAASTLTRGQFVALRFAPEEELEGLVRQVLEGRLTTPADIKRAIKNWRADEFRV